MSALFEIPHGNLLSEKSGKVIDYNVKTEGRLLEYRDAAFQQALAELASNPEYSEISGYIDMIEGRQYKGVALSSWRSQFVDNRVSRARIDALAYLTDIKPNIEVKTMVDEYKDAAAVIQGVIQMEWKTKRLDQSVEDVIDHALFGTGYWKIGCSYPGAFNIIPCGIDVVMPVLEGKSLQDSSAVIYRVFKPPSFFQQRWPKRSIGIEMEADPGLLQNQTNGGYSRPWGVQEYSWNSMSPAMRYHKAKMTPGTAVQDQWAQFPLIELMEIWVDDYHVNEYDTTVIVKDPYKELDEHNYWYRVAPGERLYPNKRLLVFGGDRLMYDGPSPYWHGKFPFAKLRLNPCVWANGGLSAYRDLKPLNIAINKIGNGIESVVDKAVKPIAITRDGAVNATSWEKFFTDRPGGKLKLTNMGNPSTDVRFIEPPNLPGYVNQHLQYLIQTFREQAGQLDLGSMAKKKQLPGGDTVEQFKDSMTTSRRRELRNVQWFLEDAGDIALPCVAQYFSRDQRFRMLGAKGLTKADFDYKPGSMVPWAGLPEEFHANFSLYVDSGSFHQGSKDRNKQMALVMRKNHDISRHELHRQLETGVSMEQNDKELQQEQAQMPQPQAKGKGPKTEMTRGQKNGKVV